MTAALASAALNRSFSEEPPAPSSVPDANATATASHPSPTPPLATCSMTHAALYPSCHSPSRILAANACATASARRPPHALANASMDSFAGASFMPPLAHSASTCLCSSLPTSVNGAFAPAATGDKGGLGECGGG